MFRRDLVGNNRAGEPFQLSHPGFARIFAPGRLTIGLFLPLWPYNGDFGQMSGQGRTIEKADQAGLGAIWLRDVPLRVSPESDVGQVYDPWTYAGWIAAKTAHLTIAMGSVIFTLRHPIDLAKCATSLDQLSGGRLVLGAASGDRPREFPAYGVDFGTRDQRFRDAVAMFRALVSDHSDGSDLELLPKPVTGRIPLIMTGSCRQSGSWLAQHGDGWLVYPGPTATADGPKQLGRKIAIWRELIPDGEFKPAVTNEWIDLVEDPLFPPTPLQGGFILRTGREGLLELLHRWQEAGVNHGALGVQHGSRPAAEVVAQLCDEVLPHFPALASAAQPRSPVW
jgi:luciferase-type oxidoreductase